MAHCTGAKLHLPGIEPGGFPQGNTASYQCTTKDVYLSLRGAYGKSNHLPPFFRILPRCPTMQRRHSKDVAFWVAFWGGRRSQFQTFGVSSSLESRYHRLRILPHQQHSLLVVHVIIIHGILVSHPGVDTSVESV